DLKSNQRDFVELVQLLFHVNHPMLPGYVSKDTPSGIPDYTPSSTALSLAKRISKSFAFKKRAYRKFYIQGIYLMGSTGTIAYGDMSDLDVWICHDSELDQNQLDELRNKAMDIERWAQSHGVDANLFLVDPEKFRKGEHGSLSSESSGSALHVLLLEEFYRTSVMLAGFFPIWWLVPPEQEKNYDEYVDDLKLKRFTYAKGCIDFGGLGSISPGEFYGATLWLLYKGINSPYKSILKILLMEAYASEYPDIDLLGLRFKSKVYDGKVDINDLDPYLMMLDKVEEYLLRNNEQQRLELARNSFYLKVDEKLSEANEKDNDWRRELLGSYVKTWCWPYTRMLTLDSRDEWKIKRVIDERKVLVNEFMNSYRIIAEFARNEEDNSTYISKSDLNVLGRKLFAAFERKAGKIEIVYRGITPDMLESHISIHQINPDGDEDYWVAFSGMVNEKEIEYHAPLHRTYSLMEMLCWCFFNKIINNKTVIALFTGNSDLSDKELELIIDTLEKLFPDEVMESTTYDYRNPSRIKALGTFVNVGLDPFSAYTRKGHHLTSGRTDALRYGGQLENLALSIEQVIITSWQEVMTYRYFGIDGLIKCLRDYIQWSPPSTGKRPPPIAAHSFSSYRGTSIANRIANLFETVIKCFYSGEYPEGTRYVLGVEWDYYILWIENDELHSASPGSLEGLYDYLGKPQENFSQIIFDPETLSDNVLPKLYTLNQPGIVQCFFEIRNGEATTYVLDEKGSLSCQTKQFHDIASLLVQYRDFFTIVHERMSLLLRDGMNQRAAVDDVYYYRVEKHADKQFDITRHSINPMMKSDRDVKLQVLGDNTDAGTMFTVYCQDHEFSTMQHGARLFDEVARHIMSLRHSQQDYPIYITDVDVSFPVLNSEPGKVQTSHYLNFKYKIESYLNQALENL
ncbi:MAG: class I adenylate cyclase, partial [Thioalkalispiraceae bacterium]